MRLLFAIVTAFLGVSLSADEELEHLIRQALLLRQMGTDEIVKSALLEDQKWTLMTELGSAEGECSILDEYETFSINDFAIDIAEKRIGQNRSVGLFCNGLDPSFHHSFIEKNILPGKCVRYVLPQRKGEQEIVLVPFHADAQLEAGISIGKEELFFETDTLDCMRVKTFVDIESDLILTIKILGKRPEAIVILNYNSR